MSSSPVTARQSQLADRLSAAHRLRFCGRETEVALFRTAIAAESASFAMLYIHGLGGVGKSALLREYAEIAAEAGVTAVRLDGRLVDPSPGGFLLAVQASLGLPDGSAPMACLRERGRVALLIDSYELLAPLDVWIRQACLPQLPASAVVAIAGRHPPAPEWTADLDWGQLCRAIPLGNLSPDESRSLLVARGVPETQHAAILAFTHGHPLALVLVSDVLCRTQGDGVFHPDRAPDVVRALLERLVAGTPSVGHRRALELCAHVRVTTEALLGALVADGDPHELFDWLRDLSFVEQSAEGVFPHDVAREALDADFRWREPEAYREMHRRIWRYVGERLRHATGHAQQRAFFDKLYLHRANPIGAQYHDYGTLGTLYAEPAAERDHAAIVDVVRRHEGPESARIARHWLARQPAPSQERAAERLGIPFSTYRYHLARGTAHVVAWLWQRELNGAVPPR